MTTGAYWNVDNPLKPWGYFDPDDQLPFPFDFAEWLTNEGATYASHVITVGPELEEVDSAHSAGVITVLVQEAAGQTALVGTKYPVSCQCIATAPLGPIRKTQTVWLKIREL